MSRYLYGTLLGGRLTRKEVAEGGGGGCSGRKEKEHSQPMNSAIFDLIQINPK
jgi:hypothetical protein